MASFLGSSMSSTSPVHASLHRACPLDACFKNSLPGLPLQVTSHPSTDEVFLTNRFSAFKRASCKSGLVVCSAEPKWKQKLAAVDAQSEKNRELASKVAEGYRRKQAAQRASMEGVDHQPLSSLEFIPFLDENGLINDCSEASAKATVYAIFDEQKVLQYVGISRQVYQSMRLHFARMPTECYYIKCKNITRPSRTMLEGTKEEWIRENQSTPPGNDDGPMQFRWENAIDCKLLMTDEEKEIVNSFPPGPAKKRALKNVARRIQEQLESQFQERNCKDELRFDPKLKDEGLLDLKSTARAPDKSIPEKSS